MTRRSLLRRSLPAAAAVASFHVVPSRVFGQPGRPGANDRIRIGFIGVGGRAQWLIANADLSQADLVAVADVFLPRCDAAAKQRPDGATWNKYQDYRKMLEKERLDAVFVETTTHARVRIGLHALQAGLDVYAEKPLTLTIAEGRALANAVRKHDRILQTGTQQRSMPVNRHASRLVREGAIGKVHTVVACNFIGPRRWEPQPAQPVPQGLDWDAWCNQTELRPYHADLHYKWSEWWDYDGGGQSWGVSGWGTHALDQVQCALGTDDTGPLEIWPDDEGPEARVTMRYANGTVLLLHGPRRKGYDDLGAIFIGDKGRIEIKRGSFTADPPELLKGAPETIGVGAKNESDDHLRNFFECLRTRKRPNADVEIGHRSTTLCHLANICRDLGRKLRWDPQAERFPGDDEANARLSRPRRKGYELPEV